MNDEPLFHYTLPDGFLPKISPILANQVAGMSLFENPETAAKFFPAMTFFSDMQKQIASNFVENFMPTNALTDSLAINFKSNLYSSNFLESLNSSIKNLAGFNLTPALLSQTLTGIDQRIADGSIPEELVQAAEEYTGQTLPRYNQLSPATEKAIKVVNKYTAPKVLLYVLTLIVMVILVYQEQTANFIIEQIVGIVWGKGWKFILEDEDED